MIDGVVVKELVVHAARIGFDWRTQHR